MWPIIFYLINDTTLEKYLEAKVFLYEIKCYSLHQCSIFAPMVGEGMEMGFIPVNISIAVPATEISNNWENGKQKIFYKPDGK